MAAGSGPGAVSPVANRARRSRTPAAPPALAKQPTDSGTADRRGRPDPGWAGRPGSAWGSHRRPAAGRRWCHRAWGGDRPAASAARPRGPARRCRVGQVRRGRPAGADAAAGCLEDLPRRLAEDDDARAHHQQHARPDQEPRLHRPPRPVASERRTARGTTLRRRGLSRTRARSSWTSCPNSTGPRSRLCDIPLGCSTRPPKRIRRAAMSPAASGGRIVEPVTNEDF